MKRISNITGVILCAGKGIRIKKLPFKKPKTLLEVFGEPIIFHQLKYMKKIGIKNIFIVVGKKGKEIKKKIKYYNNFNLNIKFIKDLKPRGIGSSLYKLKNRVNTPMIVFLGDIFLINLNLKSMIKKFLDTECSCVIGSIKDNNINNIKKNFTIELEKNKNVKRVIEKPRKPITNLKGVGVYLFDKKIFSAINSYAREKKVSDIGITEPIQTLINTKNTVYASLCAKKDININEPRDLFEINMQLLKIKKKKNFISKYALMGKNIKIINSIIGDNVKLLDTQVIKNSVLFSNVKISKLKILKSHVVTEHGKLKI
jgi:dTDP-glucose pyrophosphorylase